MHNGRRKIFDVIPTRQQACSRNHGKSVGRARLDERRDVRSLFNRHLISLRKTQLRPPLGVLVVVLARSIFLVDSGIRWTCGFRGNKRT